jgi:Flp pilus assembly pilin Flp
LRFHVFAASAVAVTHNSIIEGANEMKFIHTTFGRLITEEEGASASEYAILVAFIAVAVAAAVALFDLGGIFEGLGSKVQGLIDGAG